jgi:hypothetical protein
MKLVEELDKEAKNLREELFRISWYMRGALSIEEAFMSSYEDREIMSKIINDNLETTKKSGLPFF